ncbi:MAG: hypothetical protein WBC53_03175 [Phycisphaerae bacterium]
MAAMQAFHVMVSMRLGHLPKEPFARVAREALFEKDPNTARYSAYLLQICGTPEDDALLARRLRSACDVQLAHELCSGLMPRHPELIIEELARPAPDKQDTAARKGWRQRMIGAMLALPEGVETEKLGQIGPCLVGLVLEEPSLADPVLRNLARIRPRGAVKELQAARRSLRDDHRARVAIEAGLIALDEDSSDLRDGMLQDFRTAVQGYRGDEDWWEVLMLQSRWLAFAAARRPDPKLLKEVWAACQGLKTRDRAEILANMDEEFESAWSANSFLMFVESIPGKELNRMIRLFWRLGATLESAISGWQTTSLPKGVDEKRMYEALVNISSAWPAWARPDVRKPDCRRKNSPAD